MCNNKQIVIEGPDQILYQWDTGQRLRLHGYEPGTRVDFARCNQNKAASVYAYAEGGEVFCDIPDAILMEPNHIRGFVYVIDGGRGETVRNFLLPVIPRPKPEDYVEPEEVPTWHELEQRIKKIEDEGVPDEKIERAVEDYLEENPIEAPKPDLTGVVKSVNGKTPDENGNVEITIPDSSQNVDLTGYAKEQWVQDNYQPKGNYLTEVPSGYATEEFVKNKIAEAELGGEEVDLSGYAQKSELPTKVSQLQNDSGYLTEHQDISGKLDASALPTAINTALAQAKASGEFDGKDGADGQPGKDGADGAPGAKGDKGDKGDPGEKGDTGEQGIQGIPGEKGEKGDPGEQGDPGKDGANGKDGTSATHSWNGTVLTITSASGTSSADLKGDKGDKGDTGATGSAGKDGKTPVKGVDYWTEADQESIVQQVITALGTPVFGTVDADNNIILTGNLADGTYMLMYERADGERVEIGTVEIGGIAYTNLLPLAVGCDGNIQKDKNGNAVGYADGAYLTGNGSNPWQNASYVNDSTTHFVTGFIPYTKAQAEAGVPIYVKGVTMDTAASHTRAAGYNSYSDYTAYHDPVKFSTGKITVEELGTAYYKLTPTADFVSAMASSNAGSNFAYIRFSFPGSGSGTIITVGEPIE